MYIYASIYICQYDDDYSKITAGVRQNAGERLVTLLEDILADGEEESKVKVPPSRPAADMHMALSALHEYVHGTAAPLNSRYECFGHLLFGRSVISFIICMLILLLMPLAGLHFCVGLDFVIPSL
jgi:hypothetical protein